MINNRLYIIAICLVLSSCSNILTWHLDMGIHKDNTYSTSDTITTADDIKNYNILTELQWSTSTNEGISGNTAYLKIVKDNNYLYSVDSEGLLTAVSMRNGDIQWQIATNHDVSSGLSIVDNKLCFGTVNAKLLCFTIESLAMHSYTPIIDTLKNSTTFSKISGDIEIDLITELASPISSINNLYLLKLDNDDLYLIDPKSQDIIWKSESQNIPLRTKGASMPLIYDDNVFVARDNGSVSSYDQTNGTLKWFTIISSRSGRNDLESQRDAEMNILIQDNKIYYGHYQGDISSIDMASGNIIWSSPFSFINNIFIYKNSIYGATTDNFLVSIDQASGFLNWKKNFKKTITEPFMINNIIMTFTTDGILNAYERDTGDKIYEKDYGLDLHVRTQFIIEKNKIYFQTIDGDTVCIQVIL